MRNNLRFLYYALLTFLPLVASADPGLPGGSYNPSTGSFGGATTIQSIILIAKNIVGSLVPLFVTLALVYFIWGLAEYILESGEANKKEEGRTRMVWGTLALFVVISVWGLVNIIKDTIFSANSTSLSAPPAIRF